MRRSILFLALCFYSLVSQGAVISYVGDPSLFMPGGYFFPGSPDGKARVEALGDVKVYVESVIANPGTVTLSLSTFTDAGVPTLASGGQFYTSVAPAASGVVLGDVQNKLLMGAPIAAPQGFLRFNTAKTTY